MRHRERLRREVLQVLRRAIMNARRAGTLMVALAVVGSTLVQAQPGMPDPKQMSGIPRPVTDLPDGTVSVRLIRGEMSNNIANHAVEFTVDGKTQSVNTGPDGRAEFKPERPGGTIKAAAVVDGERLESEEFPVPLKGGIRLLLVATDKEKEARALAEAIPGEVTIGGESRIMLEPDDESVRVFYLLEIMNTAQKPVILPSTFIIDAPRDALSTTILQGSTRQASASGTRVRVQGPFPPGTTLVEVGYSLPARSGSIEISQAFPATFEQPAVIAIKSGDAKLVSPDLDRQQEIPAEGRVYIGGAGKMLPAGQPFHLTLSGMPYRSHAPRYIAPALAGGTGPFRLPVAKIT